MPKMMTTQGNNVAQFQIAGSHFGFSGARPENLGALEYTVATLLVDTTGSISGFERELKKAVIAAVDACRLAPRADNLLIRLVEFNSSIGVREIHGFLPLNQSPKAPNQPVVDTSTYPDFTVAGTTNLYDAAYATVKALTQYGKVLTDQKFSVNAALYIITDGADNQSTMTANEVQKAIAEATSQEVLESLHAVLIGINAKASLTYLNHFAAQVGINQFVDVGDATPAKLANLAKFISRSVSSQSQALGTGGASKNLTF